MHIQLSFLVPCGGEIVVALDQSFSLSSIGGEFLFLFFFVFLNFVWNNKSHMQAYSHIIVSHCCHDMAGR